MNDIENLVRQFGKQTHQRTKEIAEKLGVTIDREYLDKCFAVQWAMAAIVAEEEGDVVEFNVELAAKAEGLSQDELGVTFCLNTCRGGFHQIEMGDYEQALDIFGLVRSIHGYLLKNDYRKLFSVRGKKGGQAAHEKMNRVKAQIIEIFMAGGDWKSTRQAAKKLAVKAQELASNEGTRFTTDDVPGRLYQWFLNAKKHTSSG